MPYIKVNVLHFSDYQNVLAGTKERVRSICANYIDRCNDVDDIVKTQGNVLSGMQSVKDACVSCMNTMYHMEDYLGKAGEIYGKLDELYSNQSSNVFTVPLKTQAVRLAAPSPGSGVMNPGAQMPITPPGVTQPPSSFYVDNNYKKEDIMFNNRAVDNMYSFYNAGKGLEDIISGIKWFKDQICPPKNDFDFSPEKFNMSHKGPSGIDILGNVFDSIIGFPALIYDTYQNAKKRVEDLNEILNDSDLTQKQKDFRSNTTNILSNLNTFCDALDYGLGCIGLGKFGDIADVIGDSVNSDRTKSEIYEMHDEMNRAVDNFNNADNVLEKTGAVLEIGWEYMEGQAETMWAASVEMGEKIIVEPFKSLIGGLGKFTGWW